MTEPKQDYRYKKGQLEIEGYQITPANRYKQQDWPDWLVIQRLPDQINCVYAMADNPDGLWLAMSEKDVPLPPLAWIVKRDDDSLGIIEALAMEEFTKVVPNPPPVVHPEAGAAPALAVVPLPGQVMTGEFTPEPEGPLREAMTKALSLLQEGQPEKAEAELKNTLIELVVWCDCSPALCHKKDQLSCRQFSPLVK